MTSGGIISNGIATFVPDYQQVKDGLTKIETDRRLPIVGWVFLFGVQFGDAIHISIDGPAGNIISNSETFDRDQAQVYRAAGKRAPASTWPPGQYVMHATLVRNSALIDGVRTVFEVQ